MAIADDRTKAQIKQRLAGALSQPVEMRLYRRPDTGRLILPGGLGCSTCDAAEELARVVAEAAPEHVGLTVVDLSQNPAPEVDAVPTFTLSQPGAKPRIAFQGLPSGYEFATLLDALERVSGRGPELSPETTSKLAGLESDLELMVFVTPSCPYCPRAASLANRMALASPRIRSLVVEANEFPELSQRFEVQSVPRIVVNREGSFVGALPEPVFVESVLELAGQANTKPATTQV